MKLVKMMVTKLKCMFGKHEFEFKKYVHTKLGTYEFGYCEHCGVPMKVPYIAPERSRYR